MRRTILTVAALAMLTACASVRINGGAAPSSPSPSTEIAMRPALVDILRNQPRTPSNGGSAVIVLNGASDRNLTLCTIVMARFSAATLTEARVGLRRDSSGAVEALRPVYWPTQQPNAPGATCQQRIAVYDYPRATVIRDKYGLTGPGPYLLVVNTEGARASSIDLNGKSPAEMAALVDVFRDAFAYEKGVWDPAAEARLRTSIGSRLISRGFADTILQAMAFAVAPAARAGCAFGDARDTAC